MGRVTLQTIADRVGVSRMTVSNAFSRPDQLSPELRERVLAVADQLGYCGPDPSARALARGSTGAIGVLLTDSLTEAFTDPVATSFLAAIAEELAPSALALTLLTPGVSGDVVPARDVAMDGALVYSCVVDSPAVGWLRRRGLPLVNVDQPLRGDEPSVNVDDRGGARAGAQHLLDLGHRRIGVLTASVHGGGRTGIVDDPLSERDAWPTRERLVGWLEVLDQAGASTLVVRASLADTGSVTEGARLLLDRDDRPTAVLCFSDSLAVGVVRTAQSLGLRVPEDVSVIGFDDSPLADRAEVPLTTIRQDVEAKGRAAAAALTASLRARREGTPPPTDHVVLPVELIVRDSCGPAPGVAAR